ncbi:acyltransferase family protein [Facklamia miroungae]|uniref:Peptidoglycan/LPS O-acetylase OafA/YrhL, contains acyltransferase and SGNH-hydrolase domains n=1 Tax=Facklamia miroungae TaxID=120956 RepID=A0A1G7R1Y7_9LACT|nr:acyltransferase family protein [Facklamia miroungae]NKZ29153.1 acetyltransferase [Facklamia miroungae]SDG04782.1 Peptidoglycan/LPS O-acetylase OafA/YrhL, contains acyltransferase and SGNH-hydrolase domains [Facklamia miroungae]
MQSKVKQGRIPIFDGLKGIAILTIIAYYFFEHIVPGGFLAVNLFLFIAGFFNFRHFYIRDLQGRKESFWQFFKIRFERLFFPTLSVVLTTSTYILLFNREMLSNIRWMGLSSLAFLNNYYQIFNQQSYFVQAANPSPFTHLWYVSLYGQLVILTPILIFLLYSWHKKPQVTIRMLLIISALSAFLMGYLYKDNQDPTRIYYDLLTRLSAFTLGGSLGMAMPVNLSPKKITQKKTMTMNLIGLIAVIIAFFMIKYMFGTKPFAYRFGLTLFSIISGLIVVSSMHPSTIWNKLFRFKPFTWLGQRSFSYYLWYYPVYLLMPENISYLNRSPWLNYCFQFLLIMILAEITYQLFEKRKISLPIGQDFNWRKMKHQFDYLRSHPHSLKGVKFITGWYIFNVIMGGIALAISSPAKGVESSKEIQTIIENNLEIADKSKESEEKQVIVNNIEGLDQGVLLFANGLDITFIGDSTLAAATERLREVFPKAIFDPKVGRQLYESYDTVYALNQSGSLKPTVVTMLGSNGTFTTGQINDYINAVGLDRDQYYVNVIVDRIWTDDANRQLVKAAQNFGNVRIIDWASYARGHTEWFAEDGVHLNDQGSLELAKFIAKEIYRQR